MALTRLILTAHQPAALALFYQTDLGFFRIDAPAPATIGGLRVDNFIRLAYGPSEIDIASFDPPGHPYPPAQSSNDLSFQHFAIITPDIAAAYAALTGTAGWRPISSSGPIQLPANTGNVTAFKFRDPEGHPLEFLQPAQPAEPCIDHSAIVVADTAASIAFYATLGLTKQSGSLNQGPEQAALDDLANPIVEVTRLGDAAGRLHLELLCYRAPPPGPAAARAPADVATTRLVFTATGAASARTDPDGHAILLEP
jgi:catechol 2,3-dioxygenase-like lactoylglutathione lyase family enzyme